jgi:ADP-ribose pyrophosphatase
MGKVLLHFILFFLISIPSYAENQSHSLEKYLHYLDKYPDTLGPWGDSEKGEIEIIKDPKKIQEIECRTGRKIGVIAEDNYWIWINDAVRFPNGHESAYGRMLWRQSLFGTTGVAVMPILPNGKIVLNRNFRHATRSWEYELPRGGVNVGESVEAAARREVKEETGMVIEDLIFLGNIMPNSGSFNTVDPVFMAKVVRQEHPEQEDSEAIAAVEAFTVEEIKKGFKDGYLSVTIDGKVSHINLRDPFLAFAILQADLRDLL